MTPIAAMVKEMIARGVDADTIALAVETAETTAGVCGQSADKAESADDRRRRLDRERKRLVRGKSADSADNPQKVQAAHISEEVVSKKEEKIDAPRKAKSADKRGCRLPDDWQPTPQDMAMASMVLGGDGAAQHELTQFRDYWKAASGKNAVKNDWDAAWRFWFRNSKRGANNGNRTANPRTSGHAAILAHASERARELNRVSAMAGGAEEIPFAFGSGPVAGATGGDRGPAERGAGDRHGFEPQRERVLEGEVSPPDQYATRLSSGR